MKQFLCAMMIAASSCGMAGASIASTSSTLVVGSAPACEDRRFDAVCFVYYCTSCDDAPNLGCNGASWRGSGVLVSNGEHTYVLTAAHVLDRPPCTPSFCPKLRVRFRRGTDGRSSDSVCVGGSPSSIQQDIAVTEEYRLPAYDITKDIALLVLEHPVEMIAPIPIAPTPSSSTTIDAAMAGWGYGDCSHTVARGTLRVAEGSFDTATGICGESTYGFTCTYPNMADELPYGQTDDSGCPLLEKVECDDGVAFRVACIVPFFNKAVNATCWNDVRTTLSLGSAYALTPATPTCPPSVDFNRDGLINSDDHDKYREAYNAGACIAVDEPMTITHSRSGSGPNYSVTGTVADDGTWSPVWGAVVTAYYALASTPTVWVASSSTLTDASGNFSLTVSTGTMASVLIRTDASFIGFQDDSFVTP